MLSQAWFTTISGPWLHDFCRTLDMEMNLNNVRKLCVGQDGKWWIAQLHVPLMSVWIFSGFSRFHKNSKHMKYSPLTKKKVSLACLSLEGFKIWRLCSEALENPHTHTYDEIDSALYEWLMGQICRGAAASEPLQWPLEPQSWPLLWLILYVWCSPSSTVITLCTRSHRIIYEQRVTRWWPLLTMV